ncbi:MAG TPA: ABC transporter permease subunit [Bacteroidota bacterium]
MLRILIEKELKDIIYSTKFAVTFGAAAILVILSFYVGARNYQESMREYEAARLANANNIASLTDWQQAQHKVFRKPQPLQVLVNGVTNDIGRTTEVRPQGELTAINSRFSVDPLFAVFRFLDLNFVVIIVLSLFAILFGYDAINGEKEAGTLKLVLSNSVSRSQFILSKLLGSLLALVVPLLVPLLVGCLILIGFGIPIAANEWVRLAVLLAGGLCSFAAFLTLSTMISGFLVRSSASFLLSLVVWIFFVLIVPKVSVLAAVQLVDVPNLDVVEVQKRKFATQGFENRRIKMQEWIQANSEPGVDWSKKFNAFQDSMFRAAEKERELFFGRLNEDWRNRKALQEGWAFALSRVSPTALFQIAAMNLANTDVALKYRYLDDLDRYQDQYADFIQKKVGTLGHARIVLRFAGQQSTEEEPKPLNPTELPEFVETQRPLGETLTAALPDMGLLGIFVVIFFVGAFIGFLRFDVR